MERTLLNVRISRRLPKPVRANACPRQPRQSRPRDRPTRARRRERQPSANFFTCLIGAHHEAHGVMWSILASNLRHGLQGRQTRCTSMSNRSPHQAKQCALHVALGRRRSIAPRLRPSSAPLTCRRITPLILMRFMPRPPFVQRHTSCPGRSQSAQWSGRPRASEGPPIRPWQKHGRT